VTLWDDLSREEQRVLVNALEEGWLNCIIGDYLGHAESNGAVWIFSSDVAAIRSLIPRFTAVVRDMVERDLIDVREPGDGGWDLAESLTGRELDEVMADPKTWIWSPDGDNRMVSLLTTDHADRLLGRTFS
jgi:hypothetical protein